MADALTPKQRSAVERARLNPDLRRILFRKATGVKWYDAFQDAGFIVSSEVPRPIPAADEGFVSIPYWFITDYLVATSPELSEPKNRAYAVKVLEFMRTTTAHAREQGFSNYRVWWQFSKIVRHIPTDLIAEGDTGTFSYWLDDPYDRGLIAESLGKHWLSAVLDQAEPHALAVAKDFLRVLYKVSIVERGTGETARKKAVLRFDAWHARKITREIAPKSSRALGAAAVDIFRGQLEEVLTGLGNDKWSTIWRPAIEEHEQNVGLDDAEDVLIEAFRDSLISYVQHEPGDARPYVATTLNSAFEVVRRVAIYTIDQRFADLNTLVEKVLGDVGSDSHAHHELWHLLRNHYPTLTKDGKAKVIDSIELIRRLDENNREHEGATAYARARWLAAINQHDEGAMARYGTYVQMAGSEPDHPDFLSYSSSGWVGSESPISVEQLRAMDVPELVRTLDAYRDPRKFMEPGLEGLTKALRQTVKAESARYYKHLAQFGNLDLAYVYEVIEAYSELWSEKVQIVWDEIWPHLLTFCDELVAQPRFWAPESAQERHHFVANRHWIVGGVARLIESGTKSDDHTFSRELLLKAEGILSVLLDRETGAEFKPESDAVSIAINSSRGRCLEAFINLTLRQCRLAGSEAERSRVWAHFEKRYDSELTRASSGEYEFATLVVNYLPHFLYMSKSWVLRNLGVMFDSNPEQRWLCAMQAYSYVNRVYPEIYNHLKNNGHFVRALDDPRLKDRVDEKIIQNIAIAYVMGIERLDDENSLLRWVLRRNRLGELSHLVWFFWTMREGDGDESVHAKVLELWRHIVTAIDTTTREGRKLASRLCDWTVFIKEVDHTNRDLVYFVAPFSSDDHHSSELLESIARISERQPSEAHDIWMRVLETAHPNFPMEAVRHALENILRSGEDGLHKAKAIASRYIAAGDDEVQQMWRELVPTNAG